MKRKKRAAKRRCPHRPLSGIGELYTVHYTITNAVRHTTYLVNSLTWIIEIKAIDERDARIKSRAALTAWLEIKKLSRVRKIQVFKGCRDFAEG